MSLYKNKYRVESARLSGWDYSKPGYYFITVCAHNRASLFGRIVDGKSCLNECGTIVQDEWDKSFEIRRELMRDEFVIMPNHFHGIVRVVDIENVIVNNDNVGFLVETSGRTSLRAPPTGHHNEKPRKYDQNPYHPLWPGLNPSLPNG